MASWGELQVRRADLTEAGRSLLYQVGVGLAFLGTVRSDGGPRMCPLLTEDRLSAFLVPSPKRDDLLRDPRFALHSFPTDKNEDAFYLAGRAAPVDDPALRAALADQFIRERSQFEIDADELEPQTLFEFDVQTCLLTRTTGHGDANPQHQVWHA